MGQNIMTANNKLICIFGTGPFSVVPKQATMILKMAPVLLEDDVSIVNTGPICLSPSHPAFKPPFMVTPPCAFAPAGKWNAPSLLLKINGKAALVASSKINCAMAQGVLSFIPS